MKRYLFLLCCCLPFVSRAQTIITWAGGGTDTSNNIPANTAEIGGAPNTIVVDKQGNYYLACPLTNKIRKINASGEINTIAGTGGAGFSGDGGPAITAMFHHPACAAIDSVGNVYIADASNNRVRKIDAITGIVSTIAGTGTSGYSGDGGPAVNATLSFPSYVFIDKVGNLFITDVLNRRIRKVDTFGIISTVAGNGTWGANGDGGLAISAGIGGPRSVISDVDGNIFIADADNNCIRRVDALTGIISTIAGSGNASYNFNGDNIQAVDAKLDPNILLLDYENNLIISDNDNDRIRKIDMSTGVITTLAGDGTRAYGGDGGIATSAQLNYPLGITFDTCGNLYITTLYDNRVRRVNYNPNCFPLNINETTPLTFTLSPNPATAHITITSSTQLKQLHLVNAVGVTVLRAEHESDKITIDLSDLPTGIYFLTVYDAQGNKRTEKIIKQ